MAKIVNIEIERYRTQTILVDVTGISDWTDINAKFVLKDSVDDTEKLVLDGTVDGPNNAVTFDVLYDSLDTCEKNVYDYEVVLYKDDKTFVENCTKGECKILGVLRQDPTL